MSGAGGWAIRIFREPFTRRSWAEVLYALAALPLGIAGFVYITVSLYLGVLLAITFLGLPLIAASSLGARALGGVNRGLARKLLHLRVTAPARFSPRPGFLGWILSGLRDPIAWRARAYLLLKLPLGVASSAIAVALRAGALIFIASPLLWEVAPVTNVDANGVAHHSLMQFGSFYIDTLPKTLIPAAQGVVMWLASPWVLRGVLALDRLAIRGLLGPTSLSGRVQHLESARAHAVDDAATQLRRIERDLHDGTQAQLVALALKLGLAKEKLGDGPAPDIERARELVDTAHRTAKEAINELRDLARGIHPPVLDSGLEAALSTLAARSAVPVTLVVDIPQRPSPSIETIAYFCAAELLTNVAKHSGASHAALEVVHVEGLLRVRVSDDGVGGARAHVPEGKATGLAGLASRVRTVDGLLEISSPRGGPTVVTVELPSHA
jgi:signal transduction histidine kinase